MMKKQPVNNNNTFKWDSLVKWIAITILLIILYGNTLVKWGLDIWNDPNYSHGMLIPLVSLYIIKLRLGDLREAQTVPSNIGLFFILPALLLFVLASVDMPLLKGWAAGGWWLDLVSLGALGVVIWILIRKCLRRAKT